MYMYLHVERLPLPLQEVYFSDSSDLLGHTLVLVLYHAWGCRFCCHVCSGLENTSFDFRVLLPSQQCLIHAELVS